MTTRRPDVDVRTAFQDAHVRLVEVFEHAGQTLTEREYEAWLSIATTKVAKENVRLILREWRP